MSANLLHNLPQMLRVGDRCRGERTKRRGVDSLEQLGWAKGQHDVAYGRRMQRKTFAQARCQGDARAPEKMLDQHGLISVENREHHIRAGFLSSALQMRSDSATMPVRTRREGADLERAETHHVRAALFALEQAIREQLTDQPVDRRLRQTGAGDDVREAKIRSLGIESTEDADRSLQRAHRMTSELREFHYMELFYCWALSGG